MSTFTTPLRFEMSGVSRRGRPCVRLLEGFLYHVGQRPSKDIITVPPGFVTDFASTPRWSWILLPPFGKYAKAAVLHDYLYATHGRSRNEADKIFLEAMKVLGVSYGERNAMYLAVRCFGGSGWDRDKR